VSTVLVLILAVGGVLLALIAAVTRSLVTDEVKAWLPHISEALVRRAARRLPAEHRDRWQEEVLADLESFDDRPLTGLAHAGQVWLKKRELRSAVTSPFVELAPAIRQFLSSWARALNKTTRFTAVVQVACTAAVAVSVAALASMGALADHLFVMVVALVGLLLMVAGSIFELRYLRRRGR
jgi:hypothetical protein